MLLRKVLSVFGGSREAKSPAPQAPAALTADQWRARGNTALGRGALPEAAECYRHACAADPSDALAHLNLGFACLEIGDIATAERSLSQALALRRPDQDIVHDVRYLLGRAHLAQGRHALASADFEAAVEAKPSFAEPMQALTELSHDEGQHARALEWAQRLRAVRPSAASDIIVAQQLHALKRNDEALTLLDEVLRREPRNVAAWTGRGKVLSSLRREADSFDACEQALAIAGPTAELLANSALALSHLGRHDDGLARLDEALRLEPDNRNALLVRLTVLLDAVRPDAAIEAARRALTLRPDDADIHWNLAVAYLLMGRFREGWPEHEWRWKAADGRGKYPLENPGPQWFGEDLRGRTILLYGEQGLGDCLQMLRYVPHVAARGARVMVHLPAALHGLKLTREIARDATLVPVGAPLPAYDYQCMLMSLPLAFAAQEHTIPRDVPYLGTDPDRVYSWRRRLACAGNRLKVGIAWSGNPAHANDYRRSIALETFRGVDLPGCFFVSLQPQIREADRAALEAWPQLHRWGEELVDFDDTAALMEALDLIICVDTSVAHLAGALGRPVWILLPHAPDWRWMIDREDSPWYPTARLFRESRQGDWPAVISRVRASLEERVRQQPAAELERCIAPRPSWSELLDRAHEQFSEGRLDAALASLDAADAQAGPHPLALHARGNVLFELARYEEAASAFDAACARKPELLEAVANAATAWNRLGRPQEALERAERALALRPDHVVSLNNRVIALQALGRGSEALAAAREASLKLPHDAELRWTYGATALLNGDFENGWPALDARWELPGAGRRPRADELGCPAWTGRESIEGRTLLLIAEQGFGDTLQFVRYVPQLRQRGARVVLWVPEPLDDLLSASMPYCTVTTREQNAPLADFHIPLMDLPLAMGTRLESIPSTVPYLRARPEDTQDWIAKLPAGGGLRVGLVWSGNPAHSNDKNRSLALAALLRVAVPGVCFVSLQREVRDADRNALEGSGICDVGDQLRSFSDTAALVEALDLVVSVDTSVAHLAGALGKPVWILLSYRPDWRWMMDRDDSPWYPTARLFRQPAPGAWEPVLDTVRGALTELAATAPAST